MKTMIEKECLRELSMLRYQADKYRLAGNGFMSQQINARIRKLQSRIVSTATK
ncbi:MAG: hypothetical protein LBR84_08720 [Tannerella sp.]|jgi:hypothetical protein|nr:hypothetical protein [Tannerella sp.]